MAYQGPRAYSDGSTTSDFSGGVNNSANRNNSQQVDSLYRLLQKIQKELEETSDPKRQEELKLLEKTVKENISALKENTKTFDNFKREVKSYLKDLGSDISKTIDKFIDSQEKMAYNLNGTGRELSSVTDTLNTVFQGTGIVKQEKVYENLTKLVQAGIVNNAEQRAYLMTLKEDLGMYFDPMNGQLTKLIRLQQTDLTSYRMAIEDSLHEFLNQNFKTSEYIREGFEQVANSLFEAQSLMSAQGAVALEASVQKWMGVLGSVGMSQNSINAISQAIGAIGSGDYTALNSGAGQLLTLAAARGGLDIGSLLQNGISGGNADLLLGSLVSYMQDMGGSSGNVVKSAYAKMFGLNVSDLVSVGNLTGSMISELETGSIGTDISDLLNDTDEYVYFTKKISNMLENLVYGAATDVASDETYYGIFKGLDLLRNLSSSIFGEGLLTQVLNGTQALSLLPAFYDVTTKLGANRG